MKRQTKRNDQNDIYSKFKLKLKLITIKQAAYAIIDKTNYRKTENSI